MPISVSWREVELIGERLSEYSDEIAKFTSGGYGNSRQLVLNSELKLTLGECATRQEQMAGERAKFYHRQVKFDTKFHRASHFARAKFDPATSPAPKFTRIFV